MQVPTPKFSAKTFEIVRRTKRWSVENYHPYPVSVEDGEGVWLIDIEGNRFLDCLSCYSAVNFGYGHPKIMAAHARTARLPVLPRGAFYNSEVSWFYEELAGICPIPNPRVMPLNSGAEAVERGIKFSRRWGYQRKGIKLGKAIPEIISIVNNFHGRTYGPLSLSSDEDYKEFGPFLPGIKKVPFGNINALKAAITPHTVSVILEPVLGEAGAIVPYEGYLREVRELCTASNVLMFVDEVQTGFCRTGDLFAVNYEGIRPDGMFLGKALGGGVLKVSAVVVRAEVADLIKPGDDGSTFGGSPADAVVARAVFRVVSEERMADKAREMGKYILNGLRSINSSHVKEVRGRGLLIGIELNRSSPPARHFGDKLLLLNVAMKDTHKRVLRVAPPLIISKEEADFLLDRVEHVLTKAY